MCGVINNYGNKLNICYFFIHFICVFFTIQNLKMCHFSPFSHSAFFKVFPQKNNNSGKLALFHKTITFHAGGYLWTSEWLQETFAKRYSYGLIWGYFPTAFCAVESRSVRKVPFSRMWNAVHTLTWWYDIKNGWKMYHKRTFLGHFISHLHQIESFLSIMPLSF